MSSSLQNLAARRPNAGHSVELEISIVMPCLNEAETLGGCISEAQSAIASSGRPGEVIVADNGSRDGSDAIAVAAGARLVRVAVPGYGSALRGGIAASRGRYVLIGDADGSYDFRDLGRFVEKLSAGYQLVVGNRFDGGIAPGAMPWLHRWIGNPLLSTLGRTLFKVRVRDFHCGLRAFEREAYDRLRLSSPGMEFASEMVLRAALAGYRMTEVPTSLRRDGRSRRPHLRTWRDGWRHLRFMLLFSPRWLFLAPGLLLVALGSGAVLALIPGPVRIGRVGFDIGTLLVAASVVLVGYQIVVFGFFAEIFAIREGFRRQAAALTKAFRYVRLEAGLAAGALMFAAGAGVLSAVFAHWQAAGFGALDPRFTLRALIPAVTLLSLGIQTVFSSFFLSILGIPRGPVR